MTKIGLIGCGMWGKNLARNLAQLNVLAAVSDRCDNKAAEFAKKFNNKNLDFDAILADPSIDGVVIATPATSHDKLAIAALQAGKPPGGANMGPAAWQITFNGSHLPPHRSFSFKKHYTLHTQHTHTTTTTTTLMKWAQSCLMFWG